MDSCSILKEISKIRRGTSFTKHPVTTIDWCNVGRVTIDILPDDVLLDIFDFHVYENVEEAWMELVQVCQRWRNVVFGSPHRLNLQLVCTDSTRVREMFSIWPPLTIIIRCWYFSNSSMDNIVAALGQNDRVREIKLGRVPSRQLEEVLTAIRVPFPALTHLELWSEGDRPPVVPDPFLGGYAPRLQRLSLGCISFPFPVLRNLLLSTTHLVRLFLWNIPQSVYISPEAMVTCVSTLTSLRLFSLEFESPPPRRVQASRRSSPPTRTLLPALTQLSFQGVSEYLEDLVARIDAPLLYLRITFFHELIFNTPQLAQFISCTPTLEVRDGVHVSFSNLGASVALLSPPWTHPEEGLILRTSCRDPGWQLLSLVQLCRSSLPLRVIFSLEQLYIRENRQLPLHWQDNIERSHWLELLHPFTAVKDLYLSREFAPHIALALQELVGGRAMEVLPALQNLFLDEPRPSGPVEETVGQFVTARQLSCHPIAVSPWDRKKDEWWNPNV
jgi:hypothetical protein